MAYDGGWGGGGEGGGRDGCLGIIFSGRAEKKEALRGILFITNA